MRRWRPTTIFRLPRMPKRGSLIVTLIVLALLLALAVIQSSRPVTSTQQIEGVVSRVYDGDTVEVEGVGKVRLIGVDALDAHNEDKVLRQAHHLGLSEAAVKRWANQATALARELILGKQVRLESGPERKDDYGRTLAYVYFRSHESEVQLNRLLLEEGLATAYRSYPHPYRDEFLHLEEQARMLRKGFWMDARPDR